MKSIITIKNSSYVLVFFLMMIQIANAQYIHKKTGSLRNNFSKIKNVVFAGKLLNNEEKNQAIYIPSLFELFPANTVEGFVFNPKVKFTQNFNDERFYSITPNVRYGFGSKRFHAQLQTQYFYSVKHQGILEFSGGRIITQLNKESTLNALNNTLHTFLNRENFLKVYERSYIEFKHTFSPINAILLTTSFSYNERNPLQNIEKYQNDENFTSNFPTAIELENTAFIKHNAVFFEAELRWKKGHRFQRKFGKLISESTSPEFSILYTNAMNLIFNGDVSYQKLAFRIQDNFKTGYYSTGKLFLETGDFLQKNSLTFVDYKHFNTRQTLYGNFNINQFQLLDYYTNSTSNFYAQGHYQQYFTPYYVTSEEVRFQPVVTVNYLYTDAGRHFTELGFGIHKMRRNLRIDVYSSWSDNLHGSIGVRLGFLF